MIIKEFQGEYRWLSNFWPCKIKLDGTIYPSVEHAYMSAKSKDVNWKQFCLNNSPGKIKKVSRTSACRLVPNWEEIKLKVMEDCVRQKFNQTQLKGLLLGTGSSYIQEGNNWGDEFWGVSLKTGRGLNHLGKIIMKVRLELYNNI
jgi:ribA/ribD-fused uncharacterized protein